MPRMFTIAFTLLELESFLCPTEDPPSRDRALDKVRRALYGLPGRQAEGAKARKGETRGREIDLRRKAS